MYQYKLGFEEVKSQATEIYNNLLANVTDENVKKQASELRSLTLNVHAPIQGYWLYYEYIIDCIFESIESNNISFAKELMIPLIQKLQEHKFLNGHVNYVKPNLRRITNFKRLHSIFKSPHDVQHHHFAAQDAKRIILEYYDEIKNCGNPSATMELGSLIEEINSLERIQNSSYRTKKQEAEKKTIDKIVHYLSAFLKEFDGQLTLKH